MTVSQLHDALATCLTALDSQDSRESAFHVFAVGAQDGFLDLARYAVVVRQLSEFERACFERLGALRDGEATHARSVRWLGERARDHGRAYELLNRLQPSPWPDLLEPATLPTSAPVGNVIRTLGDLDALDAPAMTELIKGQVYPFMVALYRLVAESTPQLVSGRNLREFARVRSRFISSLA
jgi:hypothetical protein